MSDRPILRQLSVRNVAAMILREGPISRVQLARATGLSKQTISEVVRVLEDSGLVAAVGQVGSATGRPAITYRIEPAAAYVMGVDLGGTKIRAGLADLTGAVVTEDVIDTNPRGGQAVVQQIGALHQELLRRAGIPPNRLRMVVIGSPGVLDRSTGAIELAPNLPGFDRLDVVGSLTRLLGQAPLIENDVNLGAIGEQWQGRGIGCRDLVFIALGTGIGMGILIDGRLVRGARGGAGEIAYLPLGADPFTRESREVGALERGIGTHGIIQAYRAAGGEVATTVRAIFDRLPEDLAAMAAIDATARVLALAILSVATLLDPEQVVLGGSIGIRPELLERVRRLTADCLPRQVLVEPAALGDRATLMGAIAMALHQLHNELFSLPDLPAEFGPPPQPYADAAA
ncbi:ROK family transcriptional regulator [Geminicoccus flavidas]|uniref:ROK family transcriptional regulator n=1 Tax=Geminicoccus flavidas TaxID=2506407 RepID=UPI001356A152|nr:ROK family transcriptional regulator [Geminicoccus flavidas]